MSAERKNPQRAAAGAEDPRCLSAPTQAGPTDDLLKIQSKLQTRDRLLKGIAEAATILISDSHPYSRIQEALQILGHAAQVDRLYVFENSRHPETGHLVASQRFEWSRDPNEAQIDNPDLQYASYQELGMQRWYEVLSKGGSIRGAIAGFPESERKLLQAQNIRSLLVVPILIEDRFWGFVGFDDCQRERLWDSYEESILRTMAANIAESIERHRAKQALAAEKERLDVTLRSISEAVIATDLHGNVTWLNYAAEQLIAHDQHQAIGKPVDELICLKDFHKKTPHTIPLRKSIETNQSFSVYEPLILQTHSDTRRYINYTIGLLHSSSDHVVGAVVVLRDITELLRFQDEALKANKLESISLLAGGIAHDFNNLLTAITGNVSLLKITPQTDPEYEEILIETDDALQRTRQLTQQFLTFARGGSPIKEPVAIETLLRKTTTLALRGSKVRADFQFGPALDAIHADPGQISQVIHNLLVNAVQAMPRGGIVEIAAENSGPPVERNDFAQNTNYVKIRIRDHGLGIPPEHLQNIFDPYFTTKQSGSGFGLAITYSIVKRHGGHITVESKLGEGTVFEIYLPASNQAVAKDETDASKIRKGRGRILVMDDEAPIRRTLSRLLQHLGYGVALARDGDEAIQLYRNAQIQKQSFAAVLLDLTVPGGMGGVETLEHLRRLDPNVRAIASSGYSNDAILSNHRNYGFVAMIAKPYKVTDLSRVLEKVVSS